MLTIKVSHYICDTFLDIKSDISYTIESDDTEKEDTQELEDTEKINQLLIKPNIYQYLYINKSFITTNSTCFTEYLEYTTPPPELV